MLAARIHSPGGVDNLKLDQIEEPEVSDGEILVKIKLTGFNPLEYNLINGNVVYSVKPFPHIPGSEVLGEVLNDGINVRKGDRVIVFNRIFDGNCDLCLSGRENLCYNGGLWGVETNGGLTEKITIDEKNLVKIPDSIPDELAVSMPIGALTAYHALKKANASAGKTILIYGASGNTGIFAAQISRIMGLRVYGVSRKSWVKDYGVLKTFLMDQIPESMIFDIVVNSLGSNFWESSISHVKQGGSLVSFGVLTGKEAKINIATLYTREIQIIGSTGGTRSDLIELIKIMETNQFRVPVAKKFKLDQIKEAISCYETTRDGRILIEI
jgi:alcohol dehydrogenase